MGRASQYSSGWAAASPSAPELGMGSSKLSITGGMAGDSGAYNCMAAGSLVPIRSLIISGYPIFSLTCSSPPLW